MTSPELPLAIFLMGPTAAGKTLLALSLHDALPVEIVSVDSSQVYRGMDIGTAKPTVSEQLRAPHRLIDIREPTQSYSAAEFCIDASREMAMITEQGKIPLLVGGTMFYFSALEFGLSDLPSGNLAIRSRISELAQQLGWPGMHKRLHDIDPVSATRIHPNDGRRIQRALEIYELTGQPPSKITDTRPGALLPYHIVKIALWPDDRQWLHRRIAGRFDSMLEQGFVEEVEQLRRRFDLNMNASSTRIVGYRQIHEYLTGKINYSQMREQAIAATRQFAKRQITWLRNYPAIQVIGTSKPLRTKECIDFLQKYMHH
ncbi:MAG: tRNA (adenosine(37)-N6)-dimethylallyltransferase MiaA [Sulfuricaulis sp.]|uniref:tRNA (adenosine(37)-N6)-dimethylallyltransferase MiaA n=1 Tax=Sulfuricaulis sp. TaxID=2003553 RepID=UPI0034A4A0CF